MESAKNVISNFLGSSGKDTTEVEETTAPAVTNETVTPHRHEETTEALDREVHQDHYHTTVAPLSHSEKLPEQHVHNQLPTENREFRHDDGTTRAAVDAELGQFQNTSMTEGTTYSQAHGASQAGEHTHHHVHETVQPVVYKETIQPEIVHTTIPIHETHHAPSEHHGISELPTKTLDEVKQTDTNLLAGHGQSVSQREYVGDPKPYNPKFQLERHAVDKDFSHHDGLHHLDADHDHDHGHTHGDVHSHDHGHSEGKVTNIDNRGGYESGVTGATGGALGSESTAPGYDRATGDRAGTGTSYGLDNAGSTTAGGLTGSNTSGTDTTRSAAGGLGGTDTYGSDNSRSATAGGLIGTDSTYGSDTTRGATDVDRSGTGPEVSADNTQGTTIGNPRDEANTKAVGADPSEGDNLTSGEQGSRTTRGGANEGEKQGGGEASESHNNLTHELEDTMKGPRDPAVQGEEHPKLTGTGQPGSHSALFGLTPDGKKHNETMKHSTA